MDYVVAKYFDLSGVASREVAHGATSVLCIAVLALVVNYTWRADHISEMGSYMIILVLFVGAIALYISLKTWPDNEELAEVLEDKDRRKCYTVEHPFFLTEQGSLVVRREEGDDENSFRVEFPGDAKLRKAIRDGAKVSVDVEDRFDKRGRHLMSIYTLLLEENPPQA